MKSSLWVFLWFEKENFKKQGLGARGGRKRQTLEVPNMWQSPSFSPFLTQHAHT